MRNITVTVTDETYRLARVWAAERDTSISAVVEYLLRTMQGIELAGRAFPITRAKSAAGPVSTNAPAPPPAQNPATSRGSSNRRRAFSTQQLWQIVHVLQMQADARASSTEAPLKAR
jgi:hypothetical protein